MWGLVALGLPGLFAAFLGARRTIPLPLGIAGGFTFLTCALLGALVGLEARRQMQLQRERENYSTMLIILANQLRVQDDVVLQRIAGRGGPPERRRRWCSGEAREGNGVREQGTGKGPVDQALADEPD
jgi:hypothetical protein